MVPPPVRQWFLTYPQCDTAPETLLTHLKTIDDVECYVIARELHEDGNPHLHSYVKFRNGVSKSRFSCFDMDGIHGNYQPTRSPKAVVRYCTKDGVFISNFDIEMYIAKKGKVTASILKSKSTKQALEDGDISYMQARGYAYARALVTEPLTRDDVCGIWLYGKPGTGKTHICETYFPGSYNKQQNKWWDGYNGESIVHLEDLDTTTLMHHLKIWSDKWPCSGEIKGGSVHLRHQWFIVTSNYSIEEMVTRLKKNPDDPLDEALLGALDRRFRSYECLKEFRPPNGNAGTGDWIRTQRPEFRIEDFPIVLE